MNCGKCGNNLSEETKFCGKCGNLVEKTGIKFFEGVSEKEKDKFPWKGVISVIVFIIAFIVMRYLTREGVNAISEKNAKQEVINQTVLQIRSSTIFPKELDEITTWTGIREEPNAIRYEYTLHDIDESQVSSEKFKNYLVPSLCKNSDTRDILNRNINMEYSYWVKNSIQTIFISVSEKDCL